MQLSCTCIAIYHKTLLPYGNIPTSRRNMITGIRHSVRNSEYTLHLLEEIKVVVDNICYSLCIGGGSWSTAIDQICNFSQLVCHSVSYVSTEKLHIKSSHTIDTTLIIQYFIRILFSTDMISTMEVLSCMWQVLSLGKIRVQVITSPSLFTFRLSPIQYPTLEILYTIQCVKHGLMSHVFILASSYNWS
jgi:hypothetical protein